MVIAQELSLGRVLRGFRDPVSRSGAALLINTGLTGVLGFGYWLVAAHLFPASAVGRAGALVSASTLMASIGQLNLSGSLMRFLPVAGGASRWLVKRIYLIAVLGSSITCGVGLLLVDLFAAPTSPLRMNLGETLVFAAAVAATVIFTLQDSVLIGLHRTFWVPVENTLFGVLKLGLLVPASATATALSVFATWILPFALLVPGVTALLFRRFLPAALDRDEGLASQQALRLMLRRFVIGDAAAGLFGQVWTYLLPVIVLASLGSVATASFYAAFLFSTTVDQIGSNFAAAVTVAGATGAVPLRKLVWDTMRKVLAVLGPVVLVMFLFSSIMLRTYGHAYVGAASTLQLLLLACLPKAVLAIYFARCRILRNTGVSAAIQGGIFVATIAGSLVALREYHHLVSVGLVVLAVQTAACLLVGLNSLWPRRRPRHRSGLTPIMSRQVV